ncbi:hypothetical protein Tco_0244537, partial [Tanacetum coccineum]
YGKLLSVVRWSCDAWLCVRWWHVDGGRVWEVIGTRLAVDSARRFAMRRFTMSCSLSKLSANFAMDSSMVGGVDGVDGGGI